MDYAQPPAGGGYPPPGAPQQPAPQQPMPQGYGYMEQPRPYAPGLPAAPPASVILFVSLAAMLVGAILRSLCGMMEADTAQDVYPIGSLILSLGLLVGAYSMFLVALKDKDAVTAVKVGCLAVAVLLVITGVIVSAMIPGLR